MGIVQGHTDSRPWGLSPALGSDAEATGGSFPLPRDSGSLGGMVLSGGCPGPPSLPLPLLLRLPELVDDKGDTIRQPHGGNAERQWQEGVINGASLPPHTCSRATQESVGVKGRPGPGGRLLHSPSDPGLCFSAQSNAGAAGAAGPGHPESPESQSLCTEGRPSQWWAGPEAPSRAALSGLPQGRDRSGASSSPGPLPGAPAWSWSLICPRSIVL